SPKRLVLVGAVLGLGLTAGCVTSSSSPGASAPPSSSASATIALPADIVSAGKLVVATNATYPPIEYFDTDNKTIIGFDPDLGAALGRQLGIEVEFVNVTEFDAIIPGLGSGRYDIAMAFLSDLEERRDKVTFVDYFVDGATLVVKAGNPAGVRSFDDLCGRTVVVQKGSFGEVNTAEEANRKCAAAGGDPVEIVQLPAATDKQTQVRSGRADVAITNVSNASFLVKEAPDQFEIVGEPIQPEGSLIGIAVPASERQLAEALRAALQAVIDSGEYEQLLERYGLTRGAVEKAQINGE
ncbi:MAG: ABC transporter substrate-binding protein, partial [Dermatophilaceae bacterium]